MPYTITYSIDVHYQGIGTGQMTGPGSAQRMKLAATAPVVVAGGESPSAANFNSAITGGMTTDLEAQILAQLGTIQGWSSGGQ